jgi:cysteine desulfurase
MAAALAEAEQTKVFLEESRLQLRNNFERAVVTAINGSRILAADAERLWNTVSLLLAHAENTRWVAKLDKRGFQVSTGSACATGKQGPSHVLAALGLPPDEARRVIRISSGWETTAEDWQSLLAALTEVATEIIPPDNVIKLS